MQNASGWLVSVTDNAGRQATYSFNTTGRLPSATDAQGRTESYFYINGLLQKSVTLTTTQ